MVLIHRWCLYAGLLKWKVCSWGLVKCGFYMQVVFRAGLTLCCRPEWLYKIVLSVRCVYNI